MAHCAFGGVHDAGVVDEHIELVALLEEFGGAGADGFERVQVDAEELDVALAGAGGEDVFDDGLALLETAHLQERSGARCVQSPGGLGTYSGRAAGDEHDFVC